MTRHLTIAIDANRVTCGKCERVIDQLRKLRPGKWSYDRDLREWRGPAGIVVYSCAAMAPRFDGDDDTFRVEYRTRTTGERLPICGRTI